LCIYIYKEIERTVYTSISLVSFNLKPWEIEGNLLQFLSSFENFLEEASCALVLVGILTLFLFFDLVTLADEYLLNWFLIFFSFTLVDISVVVIVDLIECVCVIWLQVVQLALIHPVTLEVSDEDASTSQPHLSLSMEQCLLHLC
jgi:hypothetical protein